MVTELTVSERRQRPGRLAGAAARHHTPTRASSPSYTIPLFICCLALPIYFFIGPLRLSPYRLVLLIALIPCFMSWISGKAGKVRSPDIYVLIFTLWAGLAFFVHLGFSDAIQAAGMFVIETMGSYLLARTMIRNAVQFRSMVRWLFIVILFLVPPAIFETITNIDLFNIILGKLFSVFPHGYIRPRWGMYRVFGPFEHPILFGVFCASAFSLSLYVLGYKKKMITKLLLAAPIILNVFISFSSGPLSALVTQGGIVFYEYITKRLPNRWLMLLGAFVAAYIFIDIMSERTPLRWLIAHAAFNPATANGRLIIWDGGSAAAISHPFFGTGGPWEHPTWMSDSLDMFWLANAVAYGIPAALAIGLATLRVLFKLGRFKFADPMLSSYRTGLVITIIGYILAGWAVHFWNATHCLLLFLLGSGMWMLDQEASEPDTKGDRKAKPGIRVHSHSKIAATMRKGAM